MFFFLLALLIPSVAFANVGSIIQQQGNSVQIKRGSDTLPGGVNAAINMNDAVVTGLSTLQLRFQDNTTASVTENSRFVIDDFVYDPNRGAGRLSGYSSREWHDRHYKAKPATFPPSFLACPTLLAASVHDCPIDNDSGVDGQIQPLGRYWDHDQLNRPRNKLVPFLEARLPPLAAKEHRIDRERHR